MNPNRFGGQIFAFQRTAFNFAMDSVLTILEQNEKLADSWDRDDGGVPGQAIKAVAGWSKTVKGGLEMYREMVNGGFDNMEAFIFNPPLFADEKDQSGQVEDKENTPGE